ncbi:MAG: hypothetical protein Q6373_014040 [Candidatus Sigynarchaeota archaeon]
MEPKQHQKQMRAAPCRSPALDSRHTRAIRARSSVNALFHKGSCVRSPITRTTRAGDEPSACTDDGRAMRLHASRAHRGCGLPPASFAEMANEFKVDGAHNPSHWGCRQVGGMRGLFRNAF